MIQLWRTGVETFPFMFCQLMICYIQGEALHLATYIFISYIRT